MSINNNNNGWTSSDFNNAWANVTQRVRNAAATQRSQQKAQQAQQAAPKPSKTYTVTTTKGKQYSFDDDAYNWISSRYFRDNADSYGLDDADQYAKLTGQMSASMRKTYKNSTVDQKLAEMGLPSEKNFEKYLGEYNKWHTGGMDQVFGNTVSSEQWSKMQEMYKRNWTYDDTVEDQTRKALGLVPTKLLANYADTELDDSLLARGLPSYSELSKYNEQYNNYKGIDTLYRNAAGAITGLRITPTDDGKYITDDDQRYTIGGKTMTGKQWYAKAFFDELERTDEKGNQVYADLMPLFKNSSGVVGGDAGIDPTGDYATERGKIITSYAKAAGNAADYDDYNAFSYDDFTGKYGDYYDKYFKNVKDDNGQTVGGFLDVKAREADAEREKAFYTIEDKWFDGDKGIDAFVDRYMTDYPGNTPEQMFTDMLEHGVSEKTVKKAMRALANSAKENKAEDGTSGFYDIKDAYAKAKAGYDAKNKKAKVDDGHTEELDALYGANGYDVVDGKVIPKAADENDQKAKYKALDSSMREYMKAANKEAADDEATIDATTNAIKNALGGAQVADVDTVLDVIKSVEKQDFTNPTAMQLALADLGFTGGLSGFADDLTAGWSQEDKNKLAFYLGGAQLQNITTEDYFNDFNRAEGDSLGDTWADYGYVENRRKLDRENFSYALEWAQEQIAKGETAGDVYNTLAGAGYQEELEAYMPEEFRKAIFTDVTVPRMYEQAGGDNLAAWELMSPAERKAIAEKQWNDMTAEEKAAKYQNPDWWKYDPSVHRTTKQAFEQQLIAVLPEFINNIATSGVQAVDSIFAGISGRPEMWDTTQDMMKVQQGLAQLGKVYDETNGAAVADMVGTAAGEFLRMYTLGAVGSIAGEAFGATKAGTALANAAKNAGSWGVRKLADIGLSMATTLPFVVSSYAGSYAEAKAQGLSNGDAALYGATMGIIEGVTEGLNVDRVWGKAFGSDKFGKMIADGTKAVLGMNPVAAARLLSIPISGISEVTEELMSYTAETLWKQNINADSWGETPWDFKGFFKEAGLVSFITGAVGAGISSGSITMESLLTDYALTDSKAFHQVFGQDLCTCIAVAENLPKSVLEAYEKGGATMMSLDAYRTNDNQIASCNEGIDNAAKELDATKAKLKDDYDTELLEIEKQRAKLMGVNTNSSESVQEFVNLCNRLGIKIDFNQPIAAQAAAALDARVKQKTDDYNTAVEKAETLFANNKKTLEDQRSSYEKKRQEHYVGLYLANRDGIITEMPDELIKNVAQTYQNGGKYDPAVAEAQRAERASKLAEAEANEAVAEAEQAAQSPEDAATKARELAYNRVYKDQEAGKAYAEGRRGENDSKMTRVEFAENERQNFEAKTTAKLRRVTLELAGLEAKDGMSAKEIFAEAKKAMTPEAAQKLDMYQKLSKALGLDMVIRDVVAGTSGYVHDGKLYVTLNGKQSMLRVAAHELTHYMKGHANEQYDALRTSLVNEVGQEKFDELLQEKAQEYGLDLNEAKARLEADDEVCAELCERMLENPDALERFVQSDLDAAKTLKQRLGKTLVAIKSAIRTLNISTDTKNDLIKQQDTIEQWYKGLSDAIDNANKAGKTTATTEADTATVTDTTTEAPQAPPVETNPDLFMGEESARREQLRSDLEALAKKGTKVQDVSRQEINDVLDRVILGDKSNYNKADYAQIRGMLAQLIPEVTAYVNGDATVDANVLNERLSAAIDYMLERYGEGSEDYYNLRDLIPSKIALTDTAYKDLRAKDMTLRQASNELTKALGGKFVNFVYKKAPSYNNAMTIDELWQRITDAYGEPDGYGNVMEDALALIDYARGRNTRSSFDDLYGSQREDVIGSQVGEFLDAVESMAEGKAAETAALHSLDDDYLPLAEKYDAGIATEEDAEELRKDVDKAARDNGYTIKAYHGTTEDFTEFKRGTQGQNHDGYLEFGGGFYFTPNADEAREWVSRGRSGMSGKAAPRVMSVYLNPGRILGADDAVPGGARFLRSMWLSEADANFIANRTYRFINYLTEERGFSNTEVQDTLKALGFDAIDATFGQGKSGQYVVFDPEQIKSADLVTYDDDGDIIPPSERFNPNETDIRNMLDDDWDALIHQYGAIEQGREPRARDVQVPRQVDDQTRVSKLARSAAESPIMSDEHAEKILNDIEADKDRIKKVWSYIPVSNDEMAKKAREFISDKQPASAQREFHDMVTSGNTSLLTEAVGLQLLADAAMRDDWVSVDELLFDLRVLATDAGQRSQIFNTLKELKGIGSAWYLEKLVDKLNTQYADAIRTGEIDGPITVSDAAMQQVRAAKTQAEVDAAEAVVAKELAVQLPLTWDEKLSNWRFLSMLGNPITHARNFTGNKLMYGMGGIKDVVASGIQRLLEGTGITDASDRAHALLTPSDWKYWDNFAQKSYEEQRSNLQGGGKLGFQSLLQQNKRSFDNKVLDAIARGKNPGVMSEKGRVAGLLENIKNNGAMGMLEVADAWGLEDNYKRSLTEYMKAQGYELRNGVVGKTSKDGGFTEISTEAMNKAIEWASSQAWTNTFRGPSEFATALNKISKINPVMRLVVEGVMPFKKTPVNIAKQGFWYSPAGAIVGTVELLTKVKQGKMSAATAIDHLSSGLTGTALMALGVILAKAHILRGGGEDKKKLETYLEDTGDQTYAFKFGNVSVNMSAIAPATIPLFMGVALQEMLSRNGEDEGVDLSTITDVLAGTLNPFMEMSFMSSLNSALKNYNNEGIGGALGSTILTAAQNYGSQYLPTLGGKVAQFVDPTQRTTKSSATSPVGGNLDYYWRSLVKKVPGAEATLQPDVNIWGQTTKKDSFGDWALDFANKFILPTNIKVTNRDAVDNELIRVVESTGVVDFLPSDGNKYFTVKGEKYKMNASQYTQYSQERGQAAYAALKDVMASASYKNATDEQKAELLKKALDNAYKQVNNVWKEKLGAYDK